MLKMNKIITSLEANFINQLAISGMQVISK